MKTSRSLLVLVLLTIAALLMGCAGEKYNTSSDTTDVVTGVSLALKNADGDCVTGDVNLLKGGVLFKTVHTDCDHPSHEVLLQPGSDYVADMAPGYVCTPSAITVPAGMTYDGCVLSAPVPFTVFAGITTPVPLTFIYHRKGAADVAVFFTVGSANITLGPSADGGTTFICGSTGVACASNQICATVNNSAEGCFTDCTTNASVCVSGQSCLPVAAMIVILSQQQPPMSSLEELCVYPSNGGAGGAGGMAGNGGASASAGTAGSSGAGGALTGGSGTSGSTAGGNAAAGGTSSTGGSPSTGGTPSNGGTSATGGTPSLTGGSSATSTGGASPSTGGTSASLTGGSATGPMMSCTAPGLTSECTCPGGIRGIIVCSWDSEDNLVWSACACMTAGTGGSASSSTGGTSSSTGGTSATGGSASQNAVYRFEFTPPTTLGNGTPFVSAGENVVGWATGSGWGPLCVLKPVSGSNVQACEVSLAKGTVVDFTIEEPIPCGLGGCVYDRIEGGCIAHGASNAIVFWQDLDDSPCGGYGAPLGTVTVLKDSVPVTLKYKEGGKEGAPYDHTDQTVTLYWNGYFVA